MLPDGSVDAGFAAALGAALDARNAQPTHSCAVTEVAALPSGQVLVRLSWRDDDGVWREEGLRRLNVDGSLDSTFRPTLTGARALAVASDGAMFVSTLSNATKTQPAVFSLVRLRGDGAVDPAFAVPPGTYFIDALAAQPDGTVLIAGRRPVSTLDQGVFRLLPDGRLDASFGDAGRVALNGFVRRMVAGPAGTIYLIGDFMDVGAGASRLPRYQIARLRADGTPDPAFDPH
jgi:uncharacterized delta-60 repeat protein